MQLAGKPLQGPVSSRAMLYRTSSGESVRVRTCNDHLLVVLAKTPDRGARLNVEGTNLVLIVMPLERRTPGPVMAFLVPAEEVAEAARSSHQAWLAGRPNTKGDNRTWNLLFNEDLSRPHTGFAKRWAKYRLPGRASTLSGSSQAPLFASSNAHAGETLRLGDVIARARQQVADAAGVSPENVQITVTLG
jgi:hypothetical protein